MPTKIVSTKYWYSIGQKDWTVSDYDPFCPIEYQYFVETIFVGIKQNFVHFLKTVFTRFGAGVIDRSVGAAPEVRLVPSEVRKMLSFLNAIHEFLCKQHYDPQ